MMKWKIVHKIAHQLINHLQNISTKDTMYLKTNVVNITKLTNMAIKQISLPMKKKLNQNLKE